MLLVHRDHQGLKACQEKMASPEPLGHVDHRDCRGLLVLLVPKDPLALREYQGEKDQLVHQDRQDHQVEASLMETYEEYVKESLITSLQSSFMN